jgi:hypothetical protein
MKDVLLGPVNFQGMRPQVPAVATEESQDTGKAHGMQLSNGKTFVDRGLIEQQLYRPYAHHQAENLWTATQEMVGESWGNVSATLPGHVANKLQSVIEYHS